MQIHQDYQWLDPAARGASVAMGNFDGVHRGHQSVIDLARGHGPLGIITFEPHPRQFFAPEAPAFRLMNAEARANRLARLGVQHLYQLPFDATLASLTPEGFVTKVLSEGIGISHVVVGADFCFGKGRKGTAQDLSTLCATRGIRTTIAPLVTENGTEISSTQIRTALTEGRPRDAAAMLGHWHRIEGAVLHGEKRGRELGYPTANMSVDGLHLPKLGVYAVLVDILTGPQQGSYHGVASLGVRPMFGEKRGRELGYPTANMSVDGLHLPQLGVYAVLVDILTGPQAGSHHGVASLGVRPMFGENRPNLETFLFDFKGDLYGQHLSVALVDYLRPELKFDGLDALITQMDADSAKARAILAAL